jgi:hypothetical protein
MINWRVFFAGQFFWLLETAHFGWNFLPSSDAEIICDGIAVLITALSFVTARAKGAVKGG